MKPKAPLTSTESNRDPISQTPRLQTSTERETAASFIQFSLIFTLKILSVPRKILNSDFHFISFCSPEWRLSFPFRIVKWNENYKSSVFSKENEKEEKLIFPRKVFRIKKLGWIKKVRREQQTEMAKIPFFIFKLFSISGLRLLAGWC